MNNWVLWVREPIVLVNKDVFAISHSPLGSLFYDLLAFKDTLPCKGAFIYLRIKNSTLWEKLRFEKPMEERGFVFQ